jgi:hypothetical protein
MVSFCLVFCHSSPPSRAPHWSRFQVIWLLLLCLHLGPELPILFPLDVGRKAAAKSFPTSAECRSPKSRPPLTCGRDVSVNCWSIVRLPSAHTLPCPSATIQGQKTRGRRVNLATCVLPRFSSLTPSAGTFTPGPTNKTMFSIIFLGSCANKPVMEGISLVTKHGASQFGILVQSGYPFECAVSGPDSRLTILSKIAAF